jgi:acetolactate synthase-1/2/3 large subunit
MKATDYIAQYLAAQGVANVFEMSGGMITFLLDSMYRNGAPRVVSVHHEQSAAFAAEAAGRVTGVPGVAMATSGPGATNLLTGIGSCHFDGSPAVFITGQVNRHEQKGDRAIRQLGFQETDIVAMAGPITKAAWKVTEPQQIAEMLPRAFRLATEGRPGPVLIDIPMDCQRADIEPDFDVSGTPGSHSFDEATTRAMVAAVRRASRPLVLVGGGIRSGRATAELRAFVRKLNVPVVNTLMAVDVLPYDDPLRVGLIGSYGNRWANIALHHADLLIVLGSRLDVRQTGSQTDEFKGDKTIFHVDVEPGEMNNRILGCETILSDLKPFLTGALALLEDEPTLPDHVGWKREIGLSREEWPDTGELSSVKGVNPNQIMHQLSRGASGVGAWMVDVGQHQMWAAQSIEVGEDQRFMTSGGMGAMGFSLPAALGAAFSLPGDRTTVVIAGDGSFQTNIQELQTVRRNNLPVKMVILDNGCHGMVRQFQESYFDGRYQSTLWGYSAPDFAAVAAAYGIPSRTLAEPGDGDAAANWLLRETDGPALLNVRIDTFANAYPKMAFGKPISEMEPFAKPLDMEGT